MNNNNNNSNNNRSYTNWRESKKKKKSPQQDHQQQQQQNQNKRRRDSPTASSRRGYRAQKQQHGVIGVGHYNLDSIPSMDAAVTRALTMPEPANVEEAQQRTDATEEAIGLLEQLRTSIVDRHNRDLSRLADMERGLLSNAVKFEAAQLNFAAKRKQFAQRLLTFKSQPKDGDDDISMLQ